MHNKGFTLVELSIVLVIIGLLIGGILVGQSLIESAKVQAAIRQLQQFDAAVNSFRVKFKGIPGDTSRLDPPGDNNGSLLVDGTGCGITGPCVTSPGFTGENAAFWKHLSISGFKNASGNSYTEVVTSSIVSIGINVPKFAINDLGSYPYNVQSKNFYYFSKKTDQATAVSHFPDNPNNQNGILPEMALAIDQKIDDAAPLAGNVQALSLYQNAAPWASNLLGSICLLNLSTYNTSGTYNACEMRVAFGNP